MEKLKPWTSSGSGAEEAAERRVKKMEEEISGVLAGCGEDMKKLWEDVLVREMLRRKKIHLDIAPGL